MKSDTSAFRPQVKKPIAGARAYFGCLGIWVVGSLIASELTLYAVATLGAVETNPASVALIHEYGPFFDLVRLGSFVLVFAVAALPILIARRTLRIEQYGRVTGRFLIFAGDFLLTLAAITGAMDALGDAVLVLQRFNPFQNYIVELSEAAVVALALSLVLNKVRTDRFFRNLYQISMM